MSAASGSNNGPSLPTPRTPKRPRARLHEPGRPASAATEATMHGASQGVSWVDFAQPLIPPRNPRAAMNITLDHRRLILLSLATSTR